MIGPPSSSSAWPVDTGEMARLIRAMNTQPALPGLAPGWPPGLKITLDLMLPAGAPMAIFWGAEGLSFYNDACASLMGDRHCEVLGQPAPAFCGELWSELSPVLEAVRNTGQPFVVNERLLEIGPPGQRRQSYLDLSFSAIHSPSGGVAGVLCFISDSTERVLSDQLRQGREKAESDLREIHDQLRLAEAAGGIGSFLVDLKTDAIMASPEFCRLFGLPDWLSLYGYPIIRIAK